MRQSVLEQSLFLGPRGAIICADCSYLLFSVLVEYKSTASAHFIFPTALMEVSDETWDKNVAEKSTLQIQYKCFCLKLQKVKEHLNCKWLSYDSYAIKYLTPKWLNYTWNEKTHLEEVRTYKTQVADLKNLNYCNELFPFIKLSCSCRSVQMFL